jgi:hypothetical protein
VIDSRTIESGTPGQRQTLGIIRMPDEQGPWRAIGNLSGGVPGAVAAWSRSRRERSFCPDDGIGAVR